MNTNSSDVIKKSNEKINRLVPYGIVAFFVILTAIMGWFIWLSILSYSGLFTEHSYEKGLDFAQINKDSISHEKYPFDVLINYDGLRINVYFKGITIDNVNHIKGKLIRPVDSKQDIDLIINGYYENGVRSSVIKVPPGIWEVRLKITVAGKDHFFAQRILSEN